MLRLLCIYGHFDSVKNSYHIENPELPVDSEKYLYRAKIKNFSSIQKRIYTVP